MRYGDSDHRRGFHCGVRSRKQPLQAVPHLRYDAGELGKGVLGLDVDHPHTRVRMLVRDDELQRRVEFVDPFQPRGCPGQAAVEDLPLVV